MFSAGVTEVSVPSEGEVMEVPDKIVEQGITTIVEHADTGAYTEWVTSNNFLRAGQELIVIHRPAVAGNGNSNWPYRSNSTGAAQEQEDSAQSQAVTLFQSNSKRKKDEEPGKKKRWYRQKFCDSWLLDERFKDWIGKVADDVYKVHCRYCKVELRAGCSELLKHMKTKYHIDAKNQDRASPKELCYIVEQQVEEHQVDAEPISIESPHEIEQFAIQEQKVELENDGSRIEICESSEVRRVQILRTAPVFRSAAIVDGILKEICLSDFLGRFVLLTFYITDFECSSINLVQELISLQSEYEKYNCVLLAASGDSVVTHKAWITSIIDSGTKFPIPLVGDYNKSVAKAFGVYDEDSGCAVPSTFLIDPKGRLRHMTVNDLSVSVSLGQLENCLQILKIIDSKKTDSALTCC